MSSRRGFLKSLAAGTAIAGLPPVTEVKALHVTEHDAIVLKIPGPITQAMRYRLNEELTRTFPGVKCVILDGKADISTLRVTPSTQAAIESLHPGGYMRYTKARNKGTGEVALFEVGDINPELWEVIE